MTVLYDSIGCELFSPPIRDVFGKCVNQIYSVHKANPRNLICTHLMEWFIYRSCSQDIELSLWYACQNPVYGDFGDDYGQSDKRY